MGKQKLILREEGALHLDIAEHCSTQLPTRAYQTCQKLPLHLLDLHIMTSRVSRVSNALCLVHLLSAQVYSSHVTPGPQHCCVIG